MYMGGQVPPPKCVGTGGEAHRTQRKGRFQTGIRGKQGVRSSTVLLPGTVAGRRWWGVLGTRWTGQKLGHPAIFLNGTISSHPHRTAGLLCS